MKKIIMLSLSLTLSLVVFSCKKGKVDPVEETGRMGPGYKWELSTTDQKNSNEYYYTPSQDRVYYLKKSANYTRLVTLTVTKTDADALVPAFRVYTGKEQCTSISAPRVSLGDTASITFRRDNFPDLSYTGYFWSIPLAFSPVGTKATFTFNLSAPSSSCDGGYVAVDMASPARINSASNYWDGDYLYVVKSANK